MVGIGVAMMLTGLWSLWQRARRDLAGSALLLRLAVLMGPSGFAAVLAGWITTEAGRQPYTVYGLLRTAQSVSPIAAQAVGASLVAFIVVYFLVFGAGVFYILRLMAHTPRLDEPDIETGLPMHAAGITPAAAVASARRERDAHVRPRLHLGRADRLRGARLRAVRRLRPRHRHPVPARWLRERPRPGHELGGPGVGRQRDLAGARRRRADGGFPARLRHRAAGAVRADYGDAAGPGVSRRRLRVPLAGDGQAPLGLGVRRRLDAGGVGAGHRAGRAGAGHPGVRSQLCRRLVGLADAVQPPHGYRAGGRLRPARCHLADHEDYRRVAGARLPASPGSPGSARWL